MYVLQQPSYTTFKVCHMRSTGFNWIVIMHCFSLGHELVRIWDSTLGSLESLIKWTTKSDAHGSDAPNTQCRLEETTSCDPWMQDSWPQFFFPGMICSESGLANWWWTICLYKFRGQTLCRYMYWWKGCKHLNQGNKSFSSEVACDWTKLHFSRWINFIFDLSWPFTIQAAKLTDQTLLSTQ